MKQCFHSTTLRWQTLTKTYIDMKIRNFLKPMLMALIACSIMPNCGMAQHKPVPGNDGNKYVPYEQRKGNESIVYFTRNLSPEGLIKAYEQVCANIEGRTGVKLHTGEQNGPNIIPSAWVKALMQKDLPEANIIETNTYYTGDRYTTEQHRKTLEVNGWTFCPVDIIDEEDTTTLPVVGGKWFKKMSVGSHLKDYNSLVVLTHFKGHSQGGSAEATRTSASVAPTDASARHGFTPRRTKTTSGTLPRRSSWSE